MEKLTLEFLFLHHIPELPGITRMLTLALFFFNLGFTPCKAEQPLQGMKLPNQHAIGNFSWQYAYGSKTINVKVQIPSEVLMKTLSNFIPHKSLKLNYKQPPSMNPKISLSLTKRAILKYFPKIHPLH